MVFYFIGNPNSIVLVDAEIMVCDGISNLNYGRHFKLIQYKRISLGRTNITHSMSSVRRIDLIYKNNIFDTKGNMSCKKPSHKIDLCDNLIRVFVFINHVLCD